MSKKKTINDYTDHELSAMSDEEIQPLLSDYFLDAADAEWPPAGTTGSPPSSMSTPAFQSKFVQKCRHKATDAFKIGEIVYSGGSRWLVEDEQFPASTLVVCLLGDPVTRIVTDDPDFASLRNYESASQHQKMSIRWPDYGAPPVGPGFWQELHSIAKTKAIENIIFYCEGGHGRTGTALASILVELMKYYPADAIDYVRSSYCKEAIESSSQVQSLCDLYLIHDPSADFEDMKPKKEKGK